MLRIVLVLALLLTQPALARTLIRDAEIEHALRQVAQPIFQQAGLPASVRIYVIEDDSLNAFVANARAIFLHSGLILRLDSSDELQAVIAHEAAHIVNGHLTRRPAAIRDASTAARLGLILSAAAAAAGGAEAGFGVAAGTSAAARRSLFAHTRAEEASADQSALRWMAAAGTDPKATLAVLELIEGQEFLSAGRQDPYAQSHPLTRDRIRAVEAFAASVTPRARDRSAVEYWYGRAAMKLRAFTRPPGRTLRALQGDNSEFAVLGRAIAYHRRADLSRALSGIDALIAARPSDAYYHELRGQFLLEGRRPAEAARAYARAAQLAPREALIQAGLGRALLAAGQDAEALRVLIAARGQDPSDPSMLRDLATAHARAGQQGLATVAAAERAAATGRLDDAKTLAERAVGLLPRGSGGWLRAQDVLAVAEARR
ncbi:M48 family metalloprotease [Jannaschia seohaensis]|uniref:Putative Zn-dependent protease n=1 Tax=Jannaschia seohaensis TaxID=475081 RepID=A0A2Y9A2X4_9RHOB|nr:M48 family metalloprotease [Jannaschia seohaensis]PWJ22542.1 putative Zn-dependent protease [Jannaschia seohaensis]SSA38820.1 Putative Zn-dependent protease, contains TPR repeats [Jannaschia seohaensis]